MILLQSQGNSLASVCSLQPKILDQYLWQVNRHQDFEDSSRLGSIEIDTTLTKILWYRLS